MRLMPERECNGCPETDRVRWGCVADAIPAMPIQFDGEHTLRCPRKPYLDNPGWYNNILEFYGWREKGFLPNPGTWRDQDQRFVTICAVIDKAKSDADAEEQQIREAKQSQIEKHKRHGGAAGGGQKGHPARHWDG